MDIEAPMMEDSNVYDGADNRLENPVTTPLISVIVPIYNVEDYVRKCLDSLLHQTITQIEIICIDDGSTDASGSIADEYKNEAGWPKFRIIHTANRGLSAARNRGIDEARAEWIMFVDSDDWVSEEFCRIPFEAAVRENIELVAFQAKTVKHGKPVKRKKKDIPVGMLDEMTAYDQAGVVAWNKLYKKDLFDNIRYPESRVYEDIATTYKLVHKAKRVFQLSDHLYYHILREGSISHTLTISNRTDLFVASLERQSDLISYGYQAEKIHLCGAAIGFLSVIAPCDDLLYKKAVQIVDSTKGYPKGMSVKQKIGLMVWRISKRMFYLMCKGIGRLQTG